MSTFDQGLDAYLRRYHRHAVVIDQALPDQPSLIVSNHGFGGLFDLNSMALRSVLNELSDRPVTYLVHQLAWKAGAGALVERLGCKVGNMANAHQALEAGHHVAVFPGGDVDAAKPWSQRNQVTFAARSGFARLALQAGVPVVPVVTAGAGESVFVLTDGQSLARALRLPRILRVKALPVSVSLPWGVSLGVAGMLPYLALPTKLDTAVLASVPMEGAEPGVLAERVRRVMQARLDGLVADRIPVLG